MDSPRPRTDQVFATWQSSAFDGRSHGVTDEEFAEGTQRQQGMYQAVCGEVICLGDSFEAPGSPCPDCVDALNPVPVQAERAPRSPRRRLRRRTT